MQVIINYPTGTQRLALAAEGSTGNWSADQIPAAANLTYQYRIVMRPGSDNDTSQIWLRTDARALQVESSDAASKGYIVAPFSATQPFTTPAFENFVIYQLHVGSFTGFNDGVINSTPTSTFVNTIPRLGHICSVGASTYLGLPRK